MKLVELRAVRLEIPQRRIASPGRRPSWNDSAPRALPVNTIEGVSPAPPGRIPGATGETVWVLAVAEDGSWGLGRTSFGRPVASLIEDHFAPLLLGRDCLATMALNDLMARSSMRHGAAGLSAVAQSGIDLALWDLKGKLFHAPVYQLLGGPSKSRIRCYATCDDLDWAKELGFTAFKVSNPVTYASGRRGLALVEAKLGEARAAVGQDAELMFNPIMSFNVDFAVQLAERLRPVDLTWLEEPLPVTDLDGYVELRRRVPWMSFAAGEDHHMRWAFREIIERRCVDTIQPDLEWCGGLTEALKIYDIAEAAGLVVSPHVAGNSPFGQHFAFAMPGCDLVEYHVASPVGTPLADAMRLPGVPTPLNGYLVPSDAPGFGLEVSRDWLQPWF